MVLNTCTCILSILLLCSVNCNEAEAKRLVAEVGSNVEISCPRNASKIQVAGKNLKMRPVKGINAVFVIGNISQSDSGNYSCLDNRDNVTMEVELMVGEIPKPLDLKSCVTHASIENMTCCWDVHTFPGINTKYIFNYTIITQAVLHGRWVERETNSCFINIRDSEYRAGASIPLQCCRVAIGRDLTTNVRIRFDWMAFAENSLGRSAVESSPNKFAISPVKLEPPENLRIHSQKEGLGIKITATWDHRNTANQTLKYKLRYRVENGTWQDLKATSELTKNFTILQSYVTLEAQVKASPDGKTIGHSSEWSSSHHDVPLMEPLIQLKFTTVHSTYSIDGNTVSASWIAYEYPSEPDFRYEISIRSQNGTELFSIALRDIKLTRFRAIIPKSNGNLIVLTGCYCNRAGCSDRTEIKLNKARAPKYEAIVTLKIEEQRLTAIWKAQMASNLLTRCNGQLLSTHRHANGNSYLPEQNVEKNYDNISCNNGTLKIDTKNLKRCTEYSFAISLAEKDDGVLYSASQRSGFVPIIDENYSVYSTDWNITGVNPAGFTVIGNWSCSEETSGMSERVAYEPLNGAVNNNPWSIEGVAFSKPINCKDGPIDVRVSKPAVYLVSIVHCCAKKISYLSAKPICNEPPFDEIKTVKVPWKDRKGSIGFISTIILVGMIFATVSGVIAFRKRKMLKYVVTRALQRSIPSPNVFVTIEPHEGERIANKSFIASDSNDYEMEVFDEIGKPLLEESPANDLQVIPDYTLANVDDDHDTKFGLACTENEDPAGSSINNARQRGKESTRQHDTMTTPYDEDSIPFECEDPEYPSSYATVPGYLTCTTAQGPEESDNDDESITLYATLRPEDYASFKSDLDEERTTNNNECDISFMKS